MNVIISNERDEMLSNIKIDVIKKETGEFSVDEIIEKYQNFFFQRMVLDITAIKNFKDISNLQKLSIAFDMDKLILVLSNEEQAKDQEFISKLISMEIYNFTVNAEGVVYLYEHPNTYKDVAHLQFLDVKIEKENEAPKVQEPEAQRIIGFKNMNKGAGSTTLVYMLKNQMKKDYKVLAFQEGSHDFVYFKDKDLLSVEEGKGVNVVLKHKDHEVILVDLSEESSGDYCNEVIYLLDPSHIKLNKMVKKNRNIFKELKGQKIVLSKSMLSPKDVLDLEYEGRFKSFFNIPPLNERKTDHEILRIFLSKLGFSRGVDTSKKTKSGFLSLFYK